MITIVFLFRFMDPASLLLRTSHGSFSPLRFSSVAAGILAKILVLAAFSIPAPARAANDAPPNIFPAGLFEDVELTYVPWAGVDGDGNIHGIEGHQIMVGDDGRINGRSVFGPSIAVGDLRNKGVNDLVMADSYGFFWYFPNSGTATKPVFTQGEVIPIWLAEERVSEDIEGFENYVPRIQLLDFSGNHKLDVVAGTYAGKLFHVPNSGSPEQPLFRPTQERDRMVINTHKRGVLWCNYLAPFFTTAFNGNNLYDLVMGEGTYSANSIFLLHNTDSNDHPMFDEDHFKRMIPGMGLEQLTPAVVDWNNDGKPDVSVATTPAISIFS